MKLYYSPGACSLAVHIILREGGFNFDLVQVDLATRKTADGADYTQINPNGYVPTLELDDGQRLTEAAAILGYLADQRGDGRLAPPAGSMARYRLQEKLNFITSELHKGFGSMFHPAMPEEWKDQVKQGLGRRLEYVAGVLKDRPYLLGEEFTVADAYLFTVLGWSSMLGVDLSPWPVLGDYTARIAQRPAVQAAMQAEGLTK